MGLSVDDMHTDVEGASAVINYLKEHERKKKEKAAVKRVIDKNEELQ